LFSRQSEILENNLQAVAAESFTQQIITSDPKEKNTKNKTIIFSIVLFMVIVLFILLERFIGSKEDQ
jgi:hypothetical protein